MTDLEIVLLVALVVMLVLWHMERMRAKHLFIAAAMFHLSLIRLAKKELTMSIDSDDKIVIKEIGSDKTITIV